MAVRAVIRFSIVIFVVLSLPVAASGQDSNLSIMTTLTDECLSPALPPSGKLGYQHRGLVAEVEFDLVDRWMSRDLTPIRTDSAAAVADFPILSFQISDARVTYEKQKKGFVRRTVNVSISAILYQNDEVRQSIVSCPGVYSDEIARSSISDVEDPSVPETVSAAPQSGFLKRYVQPVIVGAASAVAVYLFFSVRSDEAAG